MISDDGLTGSPDDGLDPGPALREFIGYALATGLIDAVDVDWAVNRVLEVLRLSDPGSWSDQRAEDEDRNAAPDADTAVAGLLDVAVASGHIADTPGQRDLLDAALFGALLPAPRAVVSAFWRSHALNPAAATDDFYRMSVDSNYIHAARSQANPMWQQGTSYGPMTLTINLAKPEKDPRDIAAAAATGPSVGYPKCLLCPQNEGYAGRADHPARQNLRLIPVELGGQRWALQYSPYLYYPEHCIVLDRQHRPMRLTRGTFDRLLQFVSVFPHYFVGSNADLPIVGGSILTHDHFQGGRHRFPIEAAAVLQRLRGPGGVEADILVWPLATVRLRADRPELLAEAGHAILTAWRSHDDPEAGVAAFTGEVPHNTVTPIARFREDHYELDVVLRNNRTSEQHPDGIFHPHAQIHPVKRENIGLIEVMGLAVLPGRLAADIPQLAQALTTGEIPPDLAAHRPMLEGIAADQSADPADLVRNAVGEYFVTGLEHCGVFGPAEQSLAHWERFLKPLGYQPG